MSYADAVIRHCKEVYIDQARARGESSATITAKNVHSALGYQNRMPLVCDALRTEIFEEFAGIEKISVSGPWHGSTTTFTFRIK